MYDYYMMVDTGFALWQVEMDEAREFGKKAKLQGLSFLVGKTKYGYGQQWDRFIEGYNDAALSLHS